MPQDVDRDIFLLILDALVDRMHSPVLITEIREYIDELSASEDISLRSTIDSTVLFHLLRSWAAEGLVRHSDSGYSLTPAGEDEAASVEARRPEIAAEVRKTAELLVG